MNLKTMVFYFHLIGTSKGLRGQPRPNDKPVTCPGVPGRMATLTYFYIYDIQIYICFRAILYLLIGSLDGGDNKIESIII